MKQPNFSTDETVDLHVAWLIQREKRKKKEKKKGIGSVIFVIGIPLAILGFAMSLVAYSDIVGKDTIPSFRITGPVFLASSFILFLVGGILAEVIKIRRKRHERYDIESIELQTGFLKEKASISDSEDISSVDFKKYKKHMKKEQEEEESDDNSSIQQFKRSLSILSETLSNILPSRNCKVEPQQGDE